MAGKTRGRRSKLNRDLETRLCQLLEAGVKKTVAMPGAGISRETFSDWQRRARLGEPRFVEFAEKIEAAIAKGRIRLQMEVRRHAKADWRAPAWILEHAHADEYASKTQVLHIVEQEREILFDCAKEVLSATSYAKLLQAVAAKDAARNSSGETG